MKQHPRYFSVYGAMRANLAVSLLAAGALFGANAAHASTYDVTSLVTDSQANNDPTGLLASLGLPPAAHVDPLVHVDQSVLGIGQ
jgi:hypothetical protein